MAEHELFVNQGANLVHKIIVKNVSTNTFVNIANYTLSSQMRKSYYSQNSSANLILTKPDSANGNICMELGYTETINLAPKKYVYDVFGLNTDTGIKSVIESGVIIIEPGVTK